MIKKILFAGLIIALFSFLTIPAFLFADEGDATTYVGIDPDEPSKNAGGTKAGQYLLGDDNDTKNDTENDGDTEVFCIDGDKTLHSGKNKYTATDIDVSDEILGEPDNEADGEITATEAIAAEILSKNSTGGDAIEEQVAMWQLTGDNTSSMNNMTDTGGTFDDQKGHVQSIIANTEYWADEYIDESGYSAANPDPALTVDQFLDDQDVNEIDVTIEQDDTIFTGSAGTATATMENPLVPGLSDEDKDVYWYILEGAFNISFSPTQIVLEAFTGDGATDATAMEDNDVNGDDVDDPTASDFADKKSDNEGIAEVSYYYYHWGLAEYPENTMGVNLFAWVDIDEDKKFDIVDTSEENPAGDIDGDVVGDFKAQHQVVTHDDNGTPADKTDDTFGTKDVDMPMDVHEIEGGKVVVANVDGGNDEEIEADFEEVRNNRQRFSTIAYTEPIDDDPQFWGTLLFKYAGEDEPLAGAEFGLFDNPAASGEPVRILTTDENGYASTGNAGISYGTVYLKETSPPPGYNANTNIYQIDISGSGISAWIGGSDVNLGIPFSVENTIIPPPPPPDTPETPDTPTIAAAGIIEVAGLAYTGLNPVLPLAGIGTIIGGLGLCITSLVRRNKK